MNNKKYTEEMLSQLRKSIEGEMSQKRFFHTVEVEKMAARLGELYLPDEIDVLRAAALLHDITKEKDTQWHIDFCTSHGLSVTNEDVHAPKTFHARTAAALIPERYPEFADERVIEAVRWHTTGKADMTLAEKIIYLADYIDESRKFEDCVRLRELFWSCDPKSMSDEERKKHLRDVLILSYDLTVKALIDEEKLVDKNTVEARNFLLLEE